MRIKICHGTVIGTRYNMMYVMVLSIPVRIDDDFDRFFVPQQFGYAMVKGLVQSRI